MANTEPAKRAERTVWGIASAAGSAVVAVIGFVADVGGVREFTCSLDAFRKACLERHWVEPEAEPLTPRTLDTALIERLNGVWGRPGCQVRMRIDTSRSPVDPPIITMTGPSGPSRGEVIAAQGDFILTRTLDGQSDRLEYRFDGSELNLRDKTKALTSLVKCD